MKARLMQIACAALALGGSLFFWSLSQRDHSPGPADAGVKSVLPRQKPSNRTASRAEADVWQVVRSALENQAPARSPQLLGALESMQSTDLHPELLEVYRTIMDDGDVNECYAVFSMLEQREEREGVSFMVSLLDHPNEEIRQRAWMACESIAGKTMKNRQEMALWAQAWQPDPQVQKLMQPPQENMTAEKPWRHPSQRDGSDGGERRLGEKSPTTTNHAVD